MARRILTAVAQIKSEFAQFLTPELIRSTCRAASHTWRERVLDPVTTVHLFLLQILHGNTACPHVPRLGAVDCTGEAYCQARARLPLRVLQTLLLLQAPGCGFPVMHVLAMFHAASGFLLNDLASPLRTHDMSRVGDLHPELSAGEVLVGDRAFCSFGHLALLAARQVFGVFRARQKQIVDFRPHRRAASSQSRQRGEKGLPTSRWLKRLGKHDQFVEYPKPKQRPDWLTVEQYAALPDAIQVREWRYTIAVPGRRTRQVTIATTLLDAERYPKEDMAEWYVVLCAKKSQ